MQPNIVIGKYTGTGSTIAIELGFTPDKVEIINKTDGGPVILGFRGWTTDTALSLNTTEIGVSSGGISFIDGTFGDASATVGRGFQVSGGSKDNTSISGKVYYYTATRSSAGQQNKLGN
jgi:hypothetical protein